MQPRRGRSGSSSFLVLLGLVLLASPFSGGAFAQGNGKLQLHFPYVGQGDAAVIISPLGEVLLIDSGPSEGCGRLRAYMWGLGITNIAHMVTSHYRADHISCTRPILDAFPLVGRAVDRGGDYNSGTYAAYADVLQGRRYPAFPGMRLTLDGATSRPVHVDVVASNMTGGTDEGGDSVVVVVRFGEFDAVFAGDIGTAHRSIDASPALNVEAAIADAVGPVEVYKVNAHGDAASSSAVWLAATRPTVGVISVGAKNYAGYPASTALDRLHAAGTHTYWTSEGGGATPTPGLDTIGGSVRIDVPAGGTSFTVQSSAGADRYGTPSTPPAQAFPIGELAFSPASARPFDWVTATVRVTPSTSPPSSDLTVDADLRPFGFSAAQALTDDGASGDAVAGDAIFSFRFQVAPASAPGTLPVGFRVADGEGRASRDSAPFTVERLTDTDHDSLPDAWEDQFGLDKASNVGVDGAQADPDGDGRRNIDEYAEGTHPRGFFKRYLAEGATSGPFDTRLALLNTNEALAHVQLRFRTPTGAQRSVTLPINPMSRGTVDVRDCRNMANEEFSTIIESDVPMVVDRTVSWDHSSRYGAHAETAIAAPSPIWYLAEGATHNGFDLFYLLQNPGPTSTMVRVRYLRPSGVPLEKTYTLPPTSRTNIWVNVEDFPGLGQALASTDVSAVIESLDSTPIIVERAMYLSNQGRMFNAGHESAGVTAPKNAWFMAEGATGDYFDLFVLIANPNDQAATVKVTYLLTDGRTFSRTLTAPANSRSSIWVDEEQFDGIPGLPLADVAVSTTIEVLNNMPVIVERALWWPGAFGTWQEAHNSAGASETGTVWALAEGEVNGLHGEETYILIANTSAFAGQARVTVFFEDGTSAQRTYDLPANSRNNVAVGPDFGSVVDGKRFGAMVESLGTTPAQIVVERAMYWNSLGQNWAAGTNALATRLQ